MVRTPEEPQSRPRPFLLRFLSSLRPSTYPPMVYDRTQQLNTFAGQTVPAVQSGLDVKTVTVVQGED